MSNKENQFEEILQKLVSDYVSTDELVKKLELNLVTDLLNGYSFAEHVMVHHTFESLSSQHDKSCLEVNCPIFHWKQNELFRK